MSVINKMLRDLDSRQAGMTPNHVRHTGMTRDTFTVDSPDGPPSPQPGWQRLSVLSSALSALIVLGAGGWFLSQNNASPAKVNASPVPPTSASVVVAPLVAASVPAPVPSVSPTVSLKMDNSIKLAPTATVVPQPDPVRQSRPAPVRSLNERAVPVVAAARPVAAPASAPAPVQSPPRQAASTDALAQAQNLWKAGSRDAAMDLLHEAVTTAERGHLAGLPAASNVVLAALARELARMELAEGRVSQALAMLTRLEPALSGFADVWALRGNAAQRLGRHQESAAAYLSALKLRPDEPRWMLGAAVSLAAQGQTDEAAELAEKARTKGALSPEVATYLRQLGVVLRAR